MKNIFYDNKKEIYYDNIRLDIINMVKNMRKLTVLEIGCGTGITLRYLKENEIAAQAYGIDLKEMEDKSFLDGWIVGNIEEIDLPYEEGYFDLIIAGDVLEHLYNPWKIAKELKKFLKPGGIIIASIPNIRNYYVLKDILWRKNFKYVEAGILDITHLRFFAKKNVLELFEADYKILDIKRNVLTGPSILTRIAGKVFTELFVLQYIVKAQKPDFPKDNGIN